MRRRCPAPGFRPCCRSCGDAACHDETALPAVKLLEVGGLSFVRDGNHRVSVARAHGVVFIEAELTRVTTKAALHSLAALSARAPRRGAAFAPAPVA